MENSLDNITIKQSGSPDLMKQQTFSNSASIDPELKQGQSFSNDSKISGEHYHLFKTPSNKSQKDESKAKKVVQVEYNEELYQAKDQLQDAKYQLQKVLREIEQLKMDSANN